MQILKMVHNIYHDHLLFSQNKKNWKKKNFLVCQRGQMQKYTYAVRTTFWIVNKTHVHEIFYFCTLWRLEMVWFPKTTHLEWAMWNWLLWQRIVAAITGYRGDYLDPITRSYTAGVLWDHIWVNIGSGNAWWHQAITWTNVDLSSERSSDNHLRTISEAISLPPITEISLKIISTKFHWNHKGANELIRLATSHIFLRHCSSVEDYVPVDAIYWHPVFKWVALIWLFNSLVPGRCRCDIKFVIFKLISRIVILSISCEIALRWMSLEFTNEQSTLVQVMAWCRPATSHYLNQCWPSSMASLGHNGLKWLGIMHPTWLQEWRVPS